MVAHDYAPRHSVFPLKILITVAAAVVLSAALVAQIASDGLFQAGSAVHSVPRTISRRMSLSMYQWVGALPVAPAFIRAIVARADIDEDSLNAAERLTASLPPGPSRADLEGNLLARRGDLQLAVPRFIEAGDTSRVSKYVNNLVAARNFQVALTTQRLLVDRLRQLDDQGRLAQAEWRLAQIESTVGDHVAASRDYDAALRPFPLSETYLLGAANEALQFGNVREAGRYFDSVVRLDPASLDGHIGVGRVAARTGDVDAASREANIVRARDPQYRDLPVLEREIARAEQHR